MQIIVHDDPVGRARINLIGQADLAPFGLDEQVEQLWFLPEVTGTHELACIPFRTHGLALGDRVRLSPESQVLEIAEPSGHRVLRALLRPGHDAGRLSRSIGRIKDTVEDSGLLSEWNGARFVAIDVPPRTDVSELVEVLRREAHEAGALWEWADAMRFTFPSS